MYAIENMYVDKVDQDKLAEDAIVALLEKLDPHSNYLNKEEVKEMNEPLQGNFDGIGVQFNMLTDTLYVIQVISGGPSEKVGMRAGDRIIEVDDTIISGVKMKTPDIMKRLRGTKGTTVRVKVLRQNTPPLIEFRIIRDKIPIYSLDAAYMADKETGYIRLNRFAATSHQEYLKSFKELKDLGMKNLILDLQGNGGGYLNIAIDICNEFLAANKTIVYTEGASQKREDAKATQKGGFETGKLVVLIDETSASASEIVAGAVQDWDRAVVVGRRSFGKGLVQRPLPLPDGSMIRLTTARYYTPTGRCIQKHYENGDQDSYNKDLVERYNNGEMLHADSIHFPDSLKYNTLVNKRVVYGGGGIMPDYFVPFDTSRYTPLHREISYKGIINKVTMNYIDTHRDELRKKYKNFESFSSKFSINETFIDELIDAVKTERLSEQTDSSKVSADSIFTAKDMEDLKKSKTLISLQLKALVARDLWEINEYYRIMNQDNASFLKAVEIINDEKEYNKLLGTN
ncbi:peptidase S41 [Bacteroidales bacterium]|nr:peptidase S41 [Bacteroidales bacterium]